MQALSSFVLVFVCALGVLPSHQVPKTGEPTKDEMEVRTFIKQVDAALKIRDRSTLERIIAAGFAHLHSTGNLETRESFIDRAVAGALLSQRVPAEVLEDELRIYDRRTALRTTRVRARAPQPNGEPTEMNVRSIDVYVKMKGRWLWVSEQSTLLPMQPKTVEIDRGTLEEASALAPLTVVGRRNLSMWHRADPECSD